MYSQIFGLDFLGNDATYEKLLSYIYIFDLFFHVESPLARCPIVSENRALENSV